MNRQSLRLVGNAMHAKTIQARVPGFVTKQKLINPEARHGLAFKDIHKGATQQTPRTNKQKTNKHKKYTSDVLL